MSEQTLRDVTVLNIKGMTCASCQTHVQHALEAVPGVQSASVNLMAHTAQINTTAHIDPTTLITAVRNSGYDASPTSEANNPADDSTESPHLALRTLLALIAGAIAMLLSMPLSMHSTTSMGTTTPGAPHLAFEMWDYCLSSPRTTDPEGHGVSRAVSRAFELRLQPLRSVPELHQSTTYPII